MVPSIIDVHLGGGGGGGGGGGSIQKHPRKFYPPPPNNYALSRVGVVLLFISTSSYNLIEKHLQKILQIWREDAYGMLILSTPIQRISKLNLKCTVIRGLSSRGGAFNGDPEMTDECSKHIQY